MRIGETLRRISYSPWLAACVRRLGLRKFMQGVYANLRTNPGVVRLSLNGVVAGFSSRTPLELRCVESTWFGEKEMLGQVLSRLRAGDVFLDVGGNLGLFTIFGAKTVGPGGTVLVFEPETTAFSRLSENVKLNGLCNLRLFKIALSDSRSTKRLALGDPEAVSQSAHLADEGGPSELVQSVGFDLFAASEGLPVPRVVKMDIEGHEFTALKGMRSTLSNPSCTALFCEIHPFALPKDVGLEQVIELIKSFGFDSIRAEKRFKQIHCVAGKKAGGRVSEAARGVEAHAAI